MIVRRTFWGILTLLAGGMLAAFLLPVLAPNFPPESISVPYRLIYISISLIFLNWIWAYFSIKGLVVRRSARGLRQQLGQVLEERFEVTNRLRLFRIWMEVKDDSDLPGSSGSRVFSWIGAKEQRSYTSYTLLTRRGEYRLGPTVIYTGDPFGLFIYKRPFPTENQLLVMPYFVELNRFPFPPGFLSGGKALRRKTPEVTPQSAGVREYFPGDSLNRIHWPSVARHDRMMVREFDQDPQADVWIFVDAQRLAHFNEPVSQELPKIEKYWLWRKKYEFTLPPDTFEYAVSIAASISNFFIKQGQAVGFAAVGHLYTALSAERGDRQKNKILETLAFLRPEGDLPLLGLVDAQLGNIPRGSVAVLITASGHETVVAAAQALAERRVKPVVLLVDPFSFGAPAGIEQVAQRLAERKVPVGVIKKGDELKFTLENGLGGSNSRR